MYSKYEYHAKDEYDILHDYMENISESFTVRVYSDKPVCVSGYIGDKKILLEGTYDLVVMCVKHMYWELRDDS